MPSLRQIRASLERVDWSFPRTGTMAGSAHSLHWFPGNFIPQLPAFLIQALSAPQETVLDPFCGSGTTGIEALHLGRNAICSDRLSVCSFVTSCKIDAFIHNIDSTLIGDILDKVEWDFECKSDEYGNFGEGSSPVLDRWFSNYTLSQLRYIWKLIENESGFYRRVLCLIFSDLLFECASPGKSLTSRGKPRKHHWGWVADIVLPKKPMDHSAITFFRERLMSLPINTGEGTDTTAHSFTVQQNVKNLAITSSSIDLIVTSPPYVGVIDYTHANRLIYYWMNWEIDTDRYNEIGARFMRNRKHMFSQYQTDMLKAWEELYRVLKPGGFCAIVIGESKKFPGSVSKVIENLEKFMTKVWGPTPRFPSRRRISDRSASQPVEFVCVFRKNP